MLSGKFFSSGKKVRNFKSVSDFPIFLPIQVTSKKNSSL